MDAKEDEYLTVAEAARLLRVSAQTIYRAIQSGKMPGLVTVSVKAHRIRRDALAHLAEQKLEK